MGDCIGTGCKAESLMGQRDELRTKVAQQAAQIERQRALLAEAQNALIDYVERLEKQGGAMNYGRSVLRQIDAALAEGKV